MCEEKIVEKKKKLQPDDKFYAIYWPVEREEKKHDIQIIGSINRFCSGTTTNEIVSRISRLNNVSYELKTLPANRVIIIIKIENCNGR